ncbi:MAG TPA: 50S ribosomal protein L10 [Patescibacteria group bacterium]|nr:50S ribosomal protein L10 [Patescibacteria group bacterium]
MNKDNTAVSQNRKKKEVIVAEVTDKVNKAKAMVFTNYAGLTHQQLEKFKREVRPLEAEYAVAKNTLLKRALGDRIEGQEDKFQQPTGTLFLYGDVVAPLKVLSKLMKDFDKPEVKFGLLDGKVITDKEVVKLSTLPPREVLIAQMLGMMNAPIQGLHRALSWNLQKFVMTLSAIEKQKAQG